ncbi:MAG TPA: choice-of-anchor Q domain-containing protein, partial [Solirubrobacterales bacterium]
MRLAIALATGLVLLIGAAGAEGAQRYAAPNGTGSTCTQQQPCTLAEASNGASNGDEVIVAAGDYEITGAPLNLADTGLHLHGDFGGPMPRVFAKLGGQQAIVLSGEGVRLSYLEVQNEQTEGVGVRCTGAGTVVERARATGIGEGAAGVVAHPGCTVRDSLVQARGTNALGMESLGMLGSTGSTVINVTAIASGQDSAGIQSRYTDSGSGSHTLTLINSIVDGASDLRTEDGTGGPGRIVVSNSNFDSAKPETEGAIAGSANQTAPPLVLDAAAGDYREAPGSPTIDAGITDPANGPLDLDAGARAAGSATDIGAYEFLPPPPTPVGASAVDASAVGT